MRMHHITPSAVRISRNVFPAHIGVIYVQAGREQKKPFGHGSPQILTDSALSEGGRSQSPAESVLIRADPRPFFVFFTDPSHDCALRHQKSG